MVDEFMTMEDYSVLADARTLDLLQRQDESVRRRAEAVAMEQVAGYLRGRCDIDGIFSARGNERPDIIVCAVADIALYHMLSWRPQRMGWEIRKERYDNTLAWLAAVQAGKVDPGLPELPAENGEPSGEVLWGGARKNRFDW